MRAGARVAALAAVLAASFSSVVACGVDPEAAALCGNLDRNQVPMTVLRQLPDFHEHPRQALTTAVEQIRSTCPQHEDAAAAIELSLETFTELR